MDISSTTSSAATMSTADTNASSQAQKSSKNDSSFKDEMDKVSSSDKKEDTKTSSKTENKTGVNHENQTVEKVSDNLADNKRDNSAFQNQNGQFDMSNDFNQTLLFSGDVDMSTLQNQLGNGQQNSIDNVQTLMEANRQLANITMMTDTSQIGSILDYSSVHMDMNDAKFFTDLVQNTDKTLQGVVADLQGGIEQNVQEAAKNVKVSATLMNALSDAVKNNQSVRIDFDKDVSVIIKVDKDGALSAKFIPGDKAVEEYLKQNISVLRQRFDEQELSYKELSYSNQQQRQNQRNNNKENEHE